MNSLPWDGEPIEDAATQTEIAILVAEIAEHSNKSADEIANAIYDVIWNFCA